MAVLPPFGLVNSFRGVKKDVGCGVLHPQLVRPEPGQTLRSRRIPPPQRRGWRGGRVMLSGDPRDLWAVDDYSSLMFRMWISFLTPPPRVTPSQ